MKIQELAIIFVIIILPISILLSEYTQFQIQTIKTQTEYDAKLTTATYDAIKAFQLNAQNETYSDLANERVKDIERSVNSFRNSIMSSFKLNGYTEEELNNYIPALVYTLYDGFYIYSPYENTNYRYEYENNPYTDEPEYITDASGNKIPTEGNGENIYGLKPYMTYSCRYKKDNIDVVITYALDNHITVQGMLGDEYVNKSGYLIDNIEVKNNGIWYNGTKIEAEQLRENVGGTLYPYVKRNGTKYYWDSLEKRIIYISNGLVKIQCSDGDSSYSEWVNLITNNTYAQQYYKEADEFTKWLKNTVLVNLTYNDAYDEVIDENTGVTSIRQIWPENTAKVFDDNNIENELSNFNQHRLAVIRHKIETNLAIAISNYNSYSNVKNVFQMPQIKEDEWEHITHNISLISFLQGLPIGGKIYNGYTIVTNSESKEVVLEQDIYILGTDNNYHKIGDNNFEVDNSGIYGSAGRLNTDFKRVTLTNSEGLQTMYYYPLRAYNASYNSIVMQNDVTTYDDIYQYLNTQKVDLKKAFYTALGRERYTFNRAIDLEEGLEMYTLTLSANNGQFPGGSEEIEYTFFKGSVLTNLLAGEPTREGFLFRGYSENNTAVSAKYKEPLEEPIIMTDNLKLYAVWEEKTYTITYDANGGSGGPANVTAKHGENIYLSTDEPIRAGYYFVGWSTSSTATTPEYIVGERYPKTGGVTSDITLYAVWEPVIYTIKYNANGGSGGPPNGNVKNGENINLSTDKPTRTGYSFVGWSTSSTATTPEYKAGETYPKTGGVTSDVTLYAVWESKIKVAQVGEYVEYTANGYSSWRIMYNNNGQLDIVSKGSVGPKTLYGEYDYKDAAGILNEFCRKYIDNIYANTARSLGYASATQEYVTATFDYDSKYEPFEDEGYVNDVSQLINNNMVQTDTSVWLASRAIKGWLANLFTGDFGTEGRVRYLNTDGSDDSTFLHDSAYNHSHDENYYRTHGVRPVVSLKSELKIIGGDGTEANPYKLSN